MQKTIRQFFKPSWKKVILFLALFLAMSFWMPFIKSSTASGTRSLFWLFKNYSGQKEDLSIILSGVIIYLIVACFVSCLAVSSWVSCKTKKEVNLK